MHIYASKGHDLKLRDNPSNTLKKSTLPSYIKLFPSNFPGIKPKLLITEGDIVKKGQPIYFDKKNPELMFVTPVSGYVDKILYGDKKSIVSINIQVDEKKSANSYEKFKEEELHQIENIKIKQTLLASGLWASIRSRPFSKIADPEKKPKGIFITTQSTSPYAPSIEVILDEIDGRYLRAGIVVLNKITGLSVQMVFPVDVDFSLFEKNDHVDIHTFSGKHPSGNVGYHISKINPIKDRSTVVWYLSLQDLAEIGRLFLDGEPGYKKIIAIGGSPVSEDNKHLLITRGQLISDLIVFNNSEKKYKIISGDIFSGDERMIDSSLNYYDESLSMLSDVVKREFIGWLSPGLNKYTLSRTFISSLFPKKEQNFNSSMNGSVRSIIPIGLIEKMCLLDILPTMLLKAIISKDIELMEELGIYECSPEDFSLCSFIDASKIDIMQVIQNGLNLIEAEG